MEQGTEGIVKMWVGRVPERAQQRTGYQILAASPQEVGLSSISIHTVKYSNLSLWLCSILEDDMRHLVLTFKL